MDVEDFNERLNLRLTQAESQAAEEPDEVRFGEGGWKERYYTCKLHADQVTPRWDPTLCVT